MSVDRLQREHQLLRWPQHDDTSRVSVCPAIVDARSPRLTGHVRAEVAGARSRRGRRRAGADAPRCAPPAARRPRLWRASAKPRARRRRESVAQCCKRRRRCLVPSKRHWRRSSRSPWLPACGARWPPGPPSRRRSRSPARGRAGPRRASVLRMSGFSARSSVGGAPPRRFLIFCAAALGDPPVGDRGGADRDVDRQRRLAGGQHLLAPIPPAPRSRPPGPARAPGR